MRRIIGKSIAVTEVVCFNRTYFDSQELLVLRQLGGYEWGETGISLSQKRKVYYKCLYKVWERGGTMFKEL